MITWQQDARYGLRVLWQNRGFTATAIITLAIGIGANTAIFSAVNSVLLRSLPYAAADRLVLAWEVTATGRQTTTSPANFLDWRAQASSFSEMAAMSGVDFNITDAGEPTRVVGASVSTNFFDLLGVAPALGHTFEKDHGAASDWKTVVLSHHLWLDRFGGDPNTVGKAITLNGSSYTIIGVMPSSFKWQNISPASSSGALAELFVPAVKNDIPQLGAQTDRDISASRTLSFMRVVGRMKPNVSLAQAQSEMNAVAARLAQSYPESNANTTIRLVPLQRYLVGDSRPALFTLLFAVGFVLLIACANVANLLLARAAARRKEIAVRVALGAGRLRIVRQLLTESVLLSLVGGAFGLLFAAWGFEFIKKLIPDGLALSTSLKISLPVLGYAMLISLATGVVFGLAPALQASRTDLNEALKQGGGRGGASAGGRLRGALVMVEVALALVLLVGAGLLMQTVAHMRGQYANLHPQQLLTVRTVLPENKYGALAKRTQFYDQVLARVESLPGVVAAGYTTSVPLQWQGGANGFMIDGAQPPPNVATNAIHRQVSANYLQTIGMSLREGRYLDEHDNAQSQLVLVVNETMARKFWQGESAIGKRISFGKGDGSDPWRTIVGVVADVREMGMDAPVKAEMYLPYSQVAVLPFFKPRDLVIRTTGDPLSLVPAVRREVHAVDPDEPLSNIATMDEQLDDQTGARGIGMVLLASFAALSLLLATIGIYGVLAYFVAQHVPEIGVRLALGAQPRDILALVLKKGMSLALGGVALGLAGAFALTRVMSGLLFGVSATDPKTFALISLLIAAVALLACYIPARRAMRVDPMIALRYE